jgi:hypothetical protein
MMRRLFWVIVGALLGVTGYRRVSRLARTFTPAALGGRRGQAPGRPRSRDLADGGWASGAALFARDVREGMDLYTDRHPRLAGRTLEVQDRAYTAVDRAKEGR